MPSFDREQWQAIRPHLERAMELPPAAIAGWLSALRAEQPELAADLEMLLADHATLRREGFLENDERMPSLGPGGAGAIVGPYRLIRLLGEGGMGIVYLAEQSEPIRRSVAVKVIKPGLGSAHVLARFVAERQTLANLNHPGISKIHDAGTTEDGRPYVAMEYVAGVPLTRFCDERNLTVRERLELFLQVCAAIQHAHQKGVIHRDIKPSNLLVAVLDGRPLAKVIDFGIAKALQPALDEPLLTQTGTTLGTPEYMSPEQASAGGADVDTRSDVYALGVVLYELLVGARPFEARDVPRSTPFALLEAIREKDPPKLSARLLDVHDAPTEVAARRGTDLKRLVRLLSGELDWITLRALEKQPARRYPSAAELAADIERCLKGEPVLAGPPSALYRLRNLARRHRVTAAALAVVAVAITMGAVVSTLSLVRALRAEDRTRRQFIGSLVVHGMQKVDAADPLTGLVYLVKALDLETDPARVRSHRIRIGEVLQRCPRLLDLWRHDSAITMLALSSQGLVATGSTDSIVIVREFSSGAKRTTIRQGAAVTDGEFSPDGAVLAVASEDGRVCLWNPIDGRRQKEVVHSAPVLDLAFSPDGTLLATACADGSVRVWDVGRGAVRFEGKHQGKAQRVLFSNRGAWLATAGDDGARLWQVSTGRPSRTLVHSRDRYRGSVNDIAFSRDDRWLATAGQDFTARLWDAATGQQVKEVMRHDTRHGAVNRVRFDTDSSLLVTASNDGTTRVWRVSDTTPVGAPLRSASIVEYADVSRNRLIASATLGGMVDVWSLDGERACPSLPHGAEVTLAQFDPTGRFVLTAGADGLARVWDLAPALGDTPRIEGGFHWRVVASPDGASVAVSSGGSPERGAARVFDLSSGAPLTPALRYPAFVRGIAFSPDGHRLVTTSAGGDARVWDPESGEPLTPPLKEDFPLEFAAFSPSGETFFVASGSDLTGSGIVRVRRAFDGGPVTKPLAVDGSVFTAPRFSPDGRFLVAASSGGSGSNVRVWDAQNGRLVWEARHHDGALNALWTPDGLTVLSGGDDQRVRAWQSSSGTIAGVVLKMSGAVSSLGVTRDGARLLAGTIGGEVRLASRAAGSTPVSVMQHNGFVYESVFSPDGSLALTSAGDNTARLWDGVTGEPLTPSLAAGSLSRSATFLGDGKTWAWTGSGVYVDGLSSEARPIADLRSLVESSAARALSESGSALTLSAEEVERRFVGSRSSHEGHLPSAPLDYVRAEARRAFDRRAFADVVSALERLRSHSSLNWPDLMRLVASYAATNRWSDALDELRHHRARWQAAPELMYFEAVTLTRLSDNAGSRQLCRAALDATHNSRQPERSYWAARACLLSPSIDTGDGEEIGQRIEHAHRIMPMNWGHTELTGAMLLRSGRPREAFDLLRSAVSPDSLTPTTMLLVAAAAAHAGRRAAATQWLERADASMSKGNFVFFGPWLDAEANALRQEVLDARSGRMPVVP